MLQYVLNTDNMRGLRVLLKKCPKNDGVIGGPFVHDDDRWHMIYWITSVTKARLGKDFLSYVFDVFSAL